MSRDQWRWKYAGAASWGTLVRFDGLPVAFYGGMPRTVRLFGEDVCGVQIGDVMVEPLHRRVLTRRGPFFLVGSTFAEKLIGPGKPYSLSFGFPSERHSRLGEHLGIYQRIGKNITEASWTPLSCRRSLLFRMSAVVTGQEKKIDRLWRAMADELVDYIVPVRDSAYIRHRFLEHPAITYMPLLVSNRLTGKPVGFCIMRDHGDEGLELLDMIAPLASIPFLVESARRMAGRLGRPRLFAWLSSPVAENLRSTGPDLKSLDVPLSTIVWKVPPDARSLQDRWWLVGGDADFR